MVGDTKPATPAEKKRMGLIKVLCCVPCVLKNWPDSHCDVHHVVEGQVRLGHLHTFGACLWHHKGEIDPNTWYNKQQISGMLGSSMAHGLRNFSEEFGTQATLVLVQDYIIQRFTDKPWLEFSMPRGIILDTFYKWSDLRQADESP